MNASQTDRLAILARHKLTIEASRLNLRIMVGHASFIDSLHMHQRGAAEEAFGTMLAREPVVVVRELTVEDDVSGDTLDCRYGGGTGISDETVSVAHRAPPPRH
jgi:hypothetical protein